MKAEIIVTITKYVNHEFVDVPEVATLASVDGHDVYVLKSATEGVVDSRGELDYSSNLYREDGERVMCAWTYGRTGKSLRWAAVVYNTKRRFIVRTTNGMNGATMHGAGASLRFVDWDGSKYEEAVETSKRTGKKLLRAW